MLFGTTRLETLTPPLWVAPPLAKTRVCFVTPPLWVAPPLAEIRVCFLTLKLAETLLTLKAKNVTSKKLKAKIGKLMDVELQPAQVY